MRECPDRAVLKFALLFGQGRQRPAIRRQRNYDLVGAQGHDQGKRLLVPQPPSDVRSKAHHTRKTERTIYLCGGRWGG